MAQLSLPAGFLDLVAGTRARPEPAGVPVARRHYRIGPVPLTFRSPLTDVSDAFHRAYRVYEIPAADPGGFDVEVAAVRSPRTLRRHYRILLNGHEQCTVRRTTSILPHVEWAMNVAIARYLPHYYQVHASVMSRDGRGVLMAGSPGQGKTTLAAGLLARGWSYFSDEFALIDPDTRQLEPYPKTLCIKAGSFDTLRRAGLSLDPNRVLHKGTKGPVCLLDPLSVNPRAVSPPCPVRVVVFPEYAAGAEPRIEPVSRARALYELVQVSFNFSKFRGEGFRLLAAVVREASCIRMRTGDLADSCRLLEQHIDGLAAREAQT
jgi:HprK-related kinase A